MYNGGMEAIKFKAEYRPDSHKFFVFYQLGEHAYIEKMSLERWRYFISNLDTSIVGGHEIKFSGGSARNKRELEESIRSYFRHVDETYRRTGQTDRLIPR